MPRRKPAHASAPLGRARRALADGEWAEARQLFEQALANGEEPAVLEGLSWALWWLEEPERSLDLRERACHLALASGDRRSAGRIATSIAVDSFDVRGPAVGGGWLRRARRLLDGLPECAEQGWLALWEGHLERLVERNAERARACAARAFELAAALGLRDLELLTIGLEGLILIGEGQVVEGMRRIDESTAAAMAGEIRELDAVSQACCFLIYACEQVWDHERAAQWGARMEAFCARWRVASLFALCRTQYAAMLLQRGDWAAAETELEAALERLERTRPAAAGQGVVQLAELRRRQGREPEAARLLERAEGLTLGMVCRAAIALDAGDPVTAMALAGRALRRVAADNFGARAAALDLRLRAALAQGDRRVAAADLEGLHAIAAAVSTPPFEAAARTADGLLAESASELEPAREALEDAVDLWDRARFPYQASGARLALARVLERLNLRSLAREEARTAHAALARLGAVRDRDRAAALLGELVSPRGAAPAAAPSPLTVREREVLQLVAQGLSDKRVAVRLRLSEHTVHRHVSNILDKLDLPSRAAAVAYAARAGLL
ncbi:MAG: LuxR C-terminal-related transcriptional regulator [Acidobacteriota bacterium]